MISQVGEKFYEMFFRNYTRKQWRRDPSELDASVCGRIPVRTNRDNRFVTEKFQALPRDGYTAMFKRMLDHPRIEVRLKTDYREAKAQAKYRHLIYTGMIDEYYDFAEGRLPYRSMRFEPETIQKEFFQPAMQVNFPNDHDYTRVVEIKHATGQKAPVTTIVREYPEDFGSGKEAYYPIPAEDTKIQYAKYAERAEKEKGVTFVGRLATYRYYNMDQVAAGPVRAGRLRLRTDSGADEPGQPVCDGEVSGAAAGWIYGDVQADAVSSADRGAAEDRLP